MSAPFTEEHARMLLTTLITLDQRFAQADETLATLRASAWSKVLAEVEPQFAMNYVLRAYSEPRDFQLQVGEILQLWRAERQARQEAEDPEPDPMEGALIGNPSMVGYLRDVLDATRAGRPVSSVPRPASLVTLSPAMEERARRCVYHDLCACAHEVCRGGYLDVEEELINGLGRRYVAVRRCPACNDALLMAEDSGRARKPAVAGAGRRR